jgi:hypothetical protein
LALVSLRLPHYQPGRPKVALIPSGSQRAVADSESAREKGEESNAYVGDQRGGVGKSNIVAYLRDQSHDWSQDRPTDDRHYQDGSPYLRVGTETAQAECKDRREHD